MITLTMSAPGKNALSSELMAWLIDRLAEARGEPIFLTGAGDAFSAGLNLKEVAALDAAGMTRFLRTLERMVETLFHYPGPVVAWINGHAIAGGCIVALASDHRLMTSQPTARIGLNEVPLGLRFPPKTWHLVEHRLPRHTRERIVLEGGLYAPETALRLGLVDELVAGEAQARAYAEKIAALPGPAYSAAKETLRHGALDVDADEERHFLESVLPAWITPELKARLAAVLAR
ncbi:MAG TPA: enoyl-CoA hydratase/isomerase family protein [Polyangiaceae bacterium]|jgi:enoyl-CoA hydratase